MTRIDTIVVLFALRKCCPASTLFSGAKFFMIVVRIPADGGNSENTTLSWIQANFIEHSVRSARTVFGRVGWACVFEPCRGPIPLAMFPCVDWRTATTGSVLHSTYCTICESRVWQKIQLTSRSFPCPKSNGKPARLCYCVARVPS